MSKDNQTFPVEGTLHSKDKIIEYTKKNGGQGRVARFYVEIPNKYKNGIAKFVAFDDIATRVEITDVGSSVSVLFSLDSCGFKKYKDKEWHSNDLKCIFLKAEQADEGESIDPITNNFGPEDVIESDDLPF